MNAIEKIKTITTQVCVSLLQAAMFGGHWDSGQGNLVDTTPSVEYFESELRRSRVEQVNKSDCSTARVATVVTPDNASRSNNASAAELPSSPCSNVELHSKFSELTGIDLKIPGFAAYKDDELLHDTKLQIRSEDLDMLSVPVNDRNKIGSKRAAPSLRVVPPLSFMPMVNRISAGQMRLASPRNSSHFSQMHQVPRSNKSKGMPDKTSLTPMTPPMSPANLSTQSRYSIFPAYLRIWEQLADLMLRLCFQLENLVKRKKPNYYGVFDSRIIKREVLEILGPRLKDCLDIILDPSITKCDSR